MLRRMREGVREFCSVRGGRGGLQATRQLALTFKGIMERGWALYVCLASVLCMCVSVCMIVRLSQCVFASGRHCNQEK